MKKKICTILSLSCIAAACVFAAGCAEKSAVDKLREAGCKVFVTYNANGGKFIGTEKVYLLDGINPDDSCWTKSDDGKTHIKLTDPTNKLRPTGTTDKMTLMKTEYSLAGWYRNRELLKDEKGNALDEAGNVLTQKDEMYFLKLTNEDGSERKVTVCDGQYFYEGKVSAGEAIDGAIIKDNAAKKYIYAISKAEAKIAEMVTPAYSYSGYWDFATDEIEYAESDGEVSLILYAGWVPYYQYYYYAKNDSGEWEKYGTTYFDYVLSSSGNEKYADQGEMHLPNWQGGNGAMNYSHTYIDKSTKEFPSIAGKTFKAAYADKDCMQQYTDKITHNGTLDPATALPKDRIQNVYVEFYDEEMFKIETAEQLAANAKTNGSYEILNDLDFEIEKTTWPAVFTTGAFTGKMFSATGESITLKNVKAQYAGTTANGGLFGLIAAGAQLKNLRFENVTMDFASVTCSETDTGYGLFSGNVDEAAQIENITVAGAKLRLGIIQLQSGYKINLLAGGNASGITQEGETALEVYGEAAIDCSYYYFEPETIEIDVAKKEIKLTFLSINESEKQRREYEYYTVTWDATGKTTATPHKPYKTQP